MMTDKQYNRRRRELLADIQLAKSLGCRMVEQSLNERLKKLQAAYLKPDKTGFDAMSKGNLCTTSKYY